jgi:hypothetical protein
MSLFDHPESELLIEADIFKFIGLQVQDRVLLVHSLTEGRQHSSTDSFALRCESTATGPRCQCGLIGSRRAHSPVHLKTRMAVPLGLPKTNEGKTSSFSNNVGWHEPGRAMPHTPTKALSQKAPVITPRLYRPRKTGLKNRISERGGCSVSSPQNARTFTGLSRIL